jgi:hypothetical protein
VKPSRPEIAVFIEPEGSLRQLVVERKAWLEAQMPGQPFCSHPPHATLLVGDYAPPDVWVEEATRKLATCAAFELHTSGWQVFPDDALSGGGQTVAVRVTPSPALSDLQMNMAELLGPFCRAPQQAHPLATREPFATSLRRYGFPFVGNHWLPHFTVGSPRVPIGHPLIEKLQLGSASCTFAVTRLSVWRVHGEHHLRVREILLRG